MVLGTEPVYDGAELVGYVTTAAFGYTLGRPLALRLAARPRSPRPGRTVEIG